ncbi:glycosyltransferase family 4 protein [Lacihabitans lacunae]|uniref:Glycosyltransferase family 4 protein n=1 Tax=Lacihabitans lacunae TaxID=1028214 RepID=A0ABV7YZ89_9BACT
MKIIQVITQGHELYGAQKHVLDLSEKLKDDGHQILVIVGSKGNMTNELDLRGISFYELKFLKRNINIYYDIVAFYKLIILFKEFKPDLVASHSSKAGILVRLVCFLYKIPNVFTVHGWSFEEGINTYSRFFFLQVERLMGLISNKIICVSHSSKSYAIKKGVANQSKIEVIYNGINDLNKRNEPIINKEDVRTGLNKRLVMVAGFRPQKDYFTLIMSLKNIVDFEWEAYFIGDGPLLNEMKELVVSLNLENRIIFTGAINNVHAFLESSKIMVLSTNWEGLPLSILEGMSFNLPIIATNLDGIKEEVIAGYNGILVGRKNISELSNALRYLLSNEELRIQMGNNSRKLFLEKFTIENMYLETFKVYSKIATK